MTNEEIISKANSNNPSILEAVVEVAKIQSIAFMNWSLESGCTYSCSDENQWTNTIDPYDTISTEQLYKLFTDQQNKHDDQR